MRSLPSPTRIPDALRAPRARAAVRRSAVALVLLGAGACGRSGPPPVPAGFTEIGLATAPGLSGLAVDADGALWTVAERAGRAYRITLAPAGAPAAPTLETLTVEGVPAGTDLEGIAVLGPGRFALGTEGRLAGAATVLLAERRGDALVVTASIALPAAIVGIALPPNHGAEGVCGAGDTIIAAIEGAGEAEGKRWAPIVRIEHGAITRVHRLWLTSPTGKLSGLDCTIAADGTVTGWAIERHFAVTRLLRFTLPPTAGDVTPELAHDLGPALQGRVNLEGIAQLPDGRLVTVIDNQWRTIEGPSRLLIHP